MNITSVAHVFNAIKLQTSLSFASKTTYIVASRHRIYHASGKHSETIKNTLHIYVHHIYLMVAFASYGSEAQTKYLQENSKQKKMDLKLY